MVLSVIVLYSLASIQFILANHSLAVFWAGSFVKLDVIANVNSGKLSVNPEHVSCYILRLQYISSAALVYGLHSVTTV
jgi:hypothetical protein